MADAPVLPAPAMQFETAEQQHATQTLGMWVFLATELMLFGGLFTGYTFYRIAYASAFADASRHLESNLGAGMTAVLIISSVTMVLALHAARTDHQKLLVALLAATLVLGIAFLCMKGYEYSLHWDDQMVPGFVFHYPGPYARPAEIFFALYFLMTGLHAIHLSIAIIIVGIMLVLAIRGHYWAGHYTPIELIGLYWHFVDIVWIFLLPLLYFPGLGG